MSTRSTALGCLLSPLATRDLWTWVLNLLFPPRCIGCRQGGAWLCDECLAQIPRVEPPFCARCGAVAGSTSSPQVVADGHLSYTFDHRARAQGQRGQKATGTALSNEKGSEAALCARCRTAPLRIERIRSVVYFEGVLRKAVHRFKYSGLTALAEPLGSLMAAYWAQHPVSVDVIVPVPLHTARLRERGYNQAALLAHELARQIELVMDKRTLVRQRSTAPQVELNAEQRRENVQGAFHCSSNALAGKRVLLVDDVCTTGSTLEACAVAMQGGGARSVQALTLARAR